MERIEIIYVACGIEYLLMSLYSAYTAKKYNDNIYCTLITNLKFLDSEYVDRFFDNFIYVDIENKKNRDIKTNVDLYATHSKCAFIDCDTEFRGSLKPIVRCLDRFDIALKCTSLPVKKDYLIDEDIRSYEFSQWNGGIVFFRKNKKSKQLFRDWNKYYNLMGKRSDQPGLAKALYENPDLHVLSLGCIWNTFDKTDRKMLKKHKMYNKCKIWHYRDVKYYPEIARAVFKHFNPIVDAIEVDCKIDFELKQIKNKYKIFTSFYYKNTLSRHIFIIANRMIRTIGVTNIVNLDRIRYKEGEKFKYVNS